MPGGVAARHSLKVNETKAGKEKLTAKLEKFVGATTQASFGDPLMASSLGSDLCN